MRCIAALTALGMLSVTSILCAAQPIGGSYVGGLFGATYQFNNHYTTTNPLTNTSIQSGIGYGVLIDAGGQLGYRFCDNFRLEGEILYNKNAYSYVRIGGITFHNHTANNTGYTIDGSSTEGLGFVNFFYDHLGDRDNSVVPYVGLGIGYAYIYNVNSFYLDTVYITNSRETHTTTAPAGQVILGLSTFLDDFMSLALDVRYTGTTQTKYTTVTGQSFNSNLRFASINILFNGAFDFA